MKDLPVSTFLYAMLTLRLATVIVVNVKLATMCT